VFSNVRRVLSQYKTWLSLLYLLYDIDLYHKSKLKTIKHARAIKQAFLANQSARQIVSMLYTLIKQAFFSQSERALDCIYVIILHNLQVFKCLIAHFQYIKYSASLQGCEAVKLNTKEISSYSLGSQCNFSCFSFTALDWS
jgi:hypothetical protein